MNSQKTSRLLGRTGVSIAQLPFAFAAKPSYGRSAAYRRIVTGLYNGKLSDHHAAFGFQSTRFTLSPPPLRSHFLPEHLRVGTIAITPKHNFHSSASRFHEQRTADSVRDRSRRKEEAEAPREEEAPKASSQQEGSAGSSTGEDKHDNAEDEQEGGDKKKNEKKEEPPPPPPHGDKTPWQVFTETLRTEFKASKEWNESTKQLASSAHQFTENESVKRARAAYTAASGAATSSTATAIKSTGKALGQSAAWTWETPVVKGVRAGVNATGRGIEKATRPVRETEAFKSLKDVVDDGSSSRYGGWVEKEERRKQRELRELNEMKRSGNLGKRAEKIEEDPK